MASVEKKKSSSSTTISEVTTSSESRVQSPVSVAIRTRQQEKRDLQNLNDRLADYIQRNRELQSENYSYIIEIRTLKENQDKEIHKTRIVCEKEIKDLRLALDEVSKQKAKCELDANRFKGEKEEAANKLKAKLKECSNLLKKVENFETQLEDVKSRLNHAQMEKKRSDEIINELKQDLQSSDKQIAELRRLLENETFNRVDKENQIQSLREEMNFKESLHQQEISETRATSQSQVEQVLEEQIKEVYEQRLADELQELREMSENQIRSSREEAAKIYEAQLQDIQRRLDAKTSSETSMKGELQSLKAKVESLASEASREANLNSNLSSRVKDLEKLIEQERRWAAASLLEKDEEIKRLNNELKQVQKEYQDLNDVKLGLDLEISAYRKMLENEESRLSLSPRKRGDESASISSRLGTPRAYAIPKKRKRVVIEDSENTVEFKTLSDCQGDIQIIDYDQDGKYVKIFNKSDQDIPLSGWKLIREVGEKETSFKFNRTAIIKAGEGVCVWSAETKEAHSPPNDLLMKTNWITGDEMSTRLLNPEGTQIAIRSTTKVIKSSKHRRLADSFGDYGYGDDGDGDKQDKCVLM